MRGKLSSVAAMPRKRAAPATAEENVTTVEAPREHLSEGLRALKRLDAGAGKKTPAGLLADAWTQRHSAPRLLFRASHAVRWPMFPCA